MHFLYAHGDSGVIGVYDTSGNNKLINIVLDKLLYKVGYKKGQDVFLFSCHVQFPDSDGKIIKFSPIK